MFMCLNCTFAITPEAMQTFEGVEFFRGQRCQCSHRRLAFDSLERERRHSGLRLCETSCGAENDETADVLMY